MSCSLRAACRNGIPPSLPMCRAMVSSSIDVDRCLLLSRHKLVLTSPENRGERGHLQGFKDGACPVPTIHKCVCEATWKRRDTRKGIPSYRLNTKHYATSCAIRPKSP